MKRINKTFSLEQRLEIWKSRCETNEKGCWLWNGFRDAEGYGRVKINGQINGLHIFSYVQDKGKIPDGLELDHLCRNRNCFNPDHLEAVTHKVNCQRGDAGDSFARRTTCPKGHAYTPENTTYQKGGKYRACLTCKRDSGRKTSAQRRAHFKAEKE